MELHIDDDFDLPKIADSGQCFRWTRTGEHAFRIPHGQNCLNITQIAEGRYQLDCTDEEFRTLWRPYFDLDENYSAIRRRIDAKTDPFLYRAAEAQKGIRILRQDPWEATVSFIISQNRNIPAIRRSVELLCRAAGDALADREGNMFHAFPEARRILDLPQSALDACALGYRGKYVRAAAKAFCDGDLDFRALSSATGEEAIKSLMGLYGVGVKVASCISLFGLHQIDAFPVDTWVRRILQNEYPNGYPFHLYSPYNGIYQQYMFAFYRSRESGCASQNL